MENENIILGVFLLVLAVSGNFIAETLSCKARKLLSENMIYKNIIIIIITYYSVSVTNEAKNLPPYKNMITTLIIWTLFLLFNKMNLVFMKIVFFILIVLLILHEYKKYFKFLKQTPTVDSLENIIKLLMNLNIIIIIIGFILYFLKQYKDHYKNFSFTTFIFGSTHCNSIK